MLDIVKYLHAVKFPVMPEVAYALIRTLKDDDADVRVVRSIIERDPALSATLLRMANSAIFGMSRRVDTLESAINVVGTARIRARALSICIANSFTLPPTLNRLEFWRSSMLCAGYAQWLASSIQMDGQQAWLTGMMLRLGELIIAQRNPEMIIPIEVRPCAPGERWARERRLVSFDEGCIMAEVALRWDFPDAVVHAFYAASAPLDAAEFCPLGAVIHLASLIADDAAPSSALIAQLPADVVAALRLDTAALQASFPAPELFSDISMITS